MVLCEVAGVTRHTICHIMDHIFPSNDSSAGFYHMFCLCPYVKDDIPAIPTLSDNLE